MDQYESVSTPFPKHPPSSENHTIQPSTLSSRMLQQPAVLRTVRRPRNLGRLKKAWLQIRIYIAYRYRHKSFYGYGVIHISPKIMLKFQSSMIINECLTIDFIACNTTIPVPRVLDLFRATKDRLYISMEYVDGLKLGRVWKVMSQGQQIAVLKQLQGYVQQLRGLVPPHPGATEAVSGTCCHDIRIPQLELTGPYPDIPSFHRATGLEFIRANRMEKFKEHGGALDRCSRRARDGKYTTKFAHGDLAPRNILVDPKTYDIVSIIDWECAGWYPEWWEYTQTHRSNFLVKPEWWDIFKTHVLEPYPDSKVERHE